MEDGGNKADAGQDACRFEHADGIVARHDAHVTRASQPDNAVVLVRRGRTNTPSDALPVWDPLMMLSPGQASRHPPNCHANQALRVWWT
jgi:hypothetical protein